MEPKTLSYFYPCSVQNLLKTYIRCEVNVFGIDVTIIEPGLIATPFLDIQRQGLEGVPHPAEYDALTSAASKIGIKGEGATPGRIAKSVVKAATAKRPPQRIALPMDARVLFFVRRFIGDRVVFGIVRRAMKYPKRTNRM